MASSEVISTSADNWAKMAPVAFEWKCESVAWYKRSSANEQNIQSFHRWRSKYQTAECLDWPIGLKYSREKRPDFNKNYTTHNPARFSQISCRYWKIAPKHLVSDYVFPQKHCDWRRWVYIYIWVYMTFICIIYIVYYTIVFYFYFLKK